MRWDILVQMRLKGRGVLVIQTALQTGWGSNVISIFPLNDGTMKQWTASWSPLLQTKTGEWRSSNIVNKNKISNHADHKKHTPKHTNDMLACRKSLCFLLIWWYGQTYVSGFWHPLETFTSSAQRSIHSHFTPVSVKLHLFLLRGCVSPVIPFVPLLPQVSNRGQQHFFLLRFHTSWQLEVWRWGRSLWCGGRKWSWVWLCAEKPVKTHVCCRNVFFFPHFVAAAELFIQGIISLISLNCMILSELALILDFHTWSNVLYPWFMKAQLSTRGCFLVLE